MVIGRRTTYNSQTIGSEIEIVHPAPLPAFDGGGIKTRALNYG
jgi:hypothetical protein